MEGGDRDEIRKSLGREINKFAVNTMNLFDNRAEQTKGDKKIIVSAIIADTLLNIDGYLTVM